VITLGGRAFTGPFLAPLWSAPKAAGLYAVLVPGWRLMTFRSIHFGHSGDFSGGFLKQHLRYAEWLRIAGTDWSLYIATHEMSFSTEAQREAAAESIARQYRPEFVHPLTGDEAPSLRTMLLARALRANQED
jgi:hypothetical protein